MTGCVIIDGCRTPFAKADSEFKEEHAADLGVRAAQALMARSPLPIEEFSGLVTGNIGSPCDSANISRVIGLIAGFPDSLTAHTVARNCASGIEAVTTAVEKIRAGTGDAYLCVSTESMTGYPLIMGHKLTAMFKKSGRGRTPIQALKPFLSFRLKHMKPRIALLEGLRDPTTNMMMGDTADLLARENNISRAEQDDFALQSHEKALKAQKEGLFNDEIIPYFSKKAVVEKDSGPREGQNIEALNKLKPVFDRRHGTVTVGNACGITDGAAALTITSEECAKKHKLPILAHIRDFAWTGCDPRRMGLGPVSSSQTVLHRQNLKFDDIDVVEINEAFAAQVLSCVKAFDDDASVGTFNRDKLNPQGGAIALGHPVGATGGRLLTTVAYQLKRQGLKRGLATLCIGGGQGGAVILENPHV